MEKVLEMKLADFSSFNLEKIFWHSTYFLKEWSEVLQNVNEMMNAITNGPCNFYIFPIIT